MMMATPLATSTSQYLSAFCRALRSVPGPSLRSFGIIPHCGPCDPRRREDHAALSGRRGEQRLLFPLRGFGGRPDGGLYLGRTAAGFPYLPPQDLGLRG